MMKLIADSGGTKTDWIGVNEKGESVKLQTKSYHPIHLSVDFIEEEKVFWSKYDIRSCKLNFFGAGCLADENQKKVKVALEAIGFSNPTVQSDLFAAAFAVNENNGWVAICGTGSVAFLMKENRIAELRGGLGWEQGDEGSGYYFGKLLLEKLKTQADDYPEVKQKIEDWKSLPELWNLENVQESKFIYANLVKVVGDVADNLLVKSVHRENVELFIRKYCMEINTISFVGGYAFFQQDVIREMCMKYGISVKSIVARPLDVIADEASFLTL